MTRLPARARLSQMLPSFPLVLLAGVLALNLLVQPNLFAPATLNGNMRVFLPLILVAVGQALVVLAGGIDISVGAIVSLANAILATQVGLQGDPGRAGLWLGGVLLAGMVAGAVNGLCVAVLRLQPIITTYATSFLFGGLALWILPSPGGGVPATISAFYRDTRPLELPLAFYGIAVILLAWAGLRRTRYGRYLYAVGGQAAAAYQTGVPVAGMQFSTYVLSGLLAAGGGIALTLLTGSGNAQIGDSLTLPSVTAVVIGGIALRGGSGGLGGAVLGALILSLIPNLISFAQVPTWWQTFINAAIIVLALATPGAVRRLRGLPA
jgi:ribose transport system permease protein